jgi:hypothetical protein
MCRGVSRGPPGRISDRRRRPAAGTGGACRGGSAHAGIGTDCSKPPDLSPGVLHVRQDVRPGAHAVEVRTAPARAAVAPRSADRRGLASGMLVEPGIGVIIAAYDGER